MPRRSAASLAIAKHNGQTQYRLPAPPTLSPAEKAVWVTLVKSRPAQWFGAEHIGVVTQYCRHKIQADIIADQLNAFNPQWLADEDGLKRYDKLAGMLERETRAIAALMRSMRLTQQSLMRADTSISRNGTRPWDVAEDDDLGFEFFRKMEARHREDE